MTRYDALMEEMEELLDLYERLRQALPEDLEWYGLDRDRIAEAMVDELTGSHRNSTVTYTLFTMSTFTLSVYTGSDMIRVMGWRDGEDAILATITLTRPDGDNGPLVVRYEISDPTMGQRNLKVILPHDMVADRPKARLGGE